MTARERTFPPAGEQWRWANTRLAAFDRSDGVPHIQPTQATVADWCWRLSGLPILSWRRSIGMAGPFRPRRPNQSPEGVCVSELTDILDRFNRKERNLLIRDALGHSPSEALSLNDTFRNRIGAALGGIEIPKDAWWATDYHLNWIAGALVLWRYGEEAIGSAQIDLSTDSARRLVERSQEDVDFLIVFDTIIILVEVKAFGYFSNKQIDSKLDRWRLLKRQSELPGSNVTFHFMLMSRAKPTRLNPPPNDLLPGMSEWPHAVLNVHSPLQKLKVSGRKPGTGAPLADTKTWFIVPVPGGADDDEYGEFVEPT